jgi:hypothetical protein
MKTTFLAKNLHNLPDIHQAVADALKGGHDELWLTGHFQWLFEDHPSSQWVGRGGPTFSVKFNLATNSWLTGDGKRIIRTASATTQAVAELIQMSAIKNDSRIVIPISFSVGDTEDYSEGDDD